MGEKDLEDKDKAPGRKEMSEWAPAIEKHAKPAAKRQRTRSYRPAAPARVPGMPGMPGMPGRAKAQAQRGDRGNNNRVSLSKAQRQKIKELRDKQVNNLPF